MLTSLGYICDQADDPYTAFAELCQRPGEYQAVILSLASLYREELAIIAAIRRCFANMEIWLAQTDGRHTALAEALRAGADGLVSEEGLLRLALPSDPPPAQHALETTVEAPAPELPAPAAESVDAPAASESSDIPSTPEFSDQHYDGASMMEPILTADELRALLQEQPLSPPGSDAMR